MTTLLHTIDIETAPKPAAAIIWMHGLGADGNDFVPLVPELDLRGCAAIRFVFPTADTRRVTVNGGYMMRAWYDIFDTGIDRRDDEVGLRASQLQVEALIAREVARGIPAERIVLAGFSQGCAMTLQTGLRHPQKLAGLMCLSGYLPLSTKLAAEHSPASLEVPIFMAHGDDDTVIPIDRGEQSRTFLAAQGYAVEWREYAMGHTLCPQEIADIGAWLRRVLPA
jgi:phospholipase/carboxylesterase